MKITYEQLYRSYPVFKHMLDQSLPINTALKFQNLMENINTHLKEIENIQSELILKYGEDGEDDNSVEIPEDKRDEFLKELKNSLKKEIVITWDLLKLEQLGEHLAISIRDLDNISYLLEDYQSMAIL